MIESHDGIRKAAILIDSLDEATAEVLLGQMSSELAAQVRAAGPVWVTSPWASASRSWPSFWTPACSRRRSCSSSRPTRPLTRWPRSPPQNRLRGWPPRRAGLPPPRSRRRRSTIRRLPWPAAWPRKTRRRSAWFWLTCRPPRGRSAATFAGGTPGGDPAVSGAAGIAAVGTQLRSRPGTAALALRPHGRQTVPNTRTFASSPRRPFAAASRGTSGRRDVWRDGTGRDVAADRF